ncbi:response regulator [bacterium AH-315-C07]|nr:response regulator [bacterium AH-315-C07]
MKIRSIIVDDEEFARENLRMLLEDNCPEIEIVGLARDVESAKSIISREKPDAVFLDIRMPSGLEGFDLLDQVANRNFQVVFVTAFEEYAIKALNSNALHYVLKPIDIDDLRSAVAKLVDNKNKFDSNSSTASASSESMHVVHSETKSERPPNKITINHSKGVKIIEDAEILRLEASSNCTLIHFTDGSHYLDTRTLKVYEEMLDEARFCRIHKSHIINLDSLQEYVMDKGIGVIMKDGTNLPVSRERRGLLKQKMAEL